MAHNILIGGRRLDPKDAAKVLLPLDTDLACPSCNGQHVGAVDAKTGIRLPGEAQQFVPRQQDRWCHDCGHRWMTVLPPAVYSQLAGGSR